MPNVYDEKIKEHGIILGKKFDGKSLKLRSLKETDLPLLIRWNQDRELLQWVEVNKEKVLSEEEIVKLYTKASYHKLCFLIQFEEQAIGECWLADFSSSGQIKSARIDLIIGEKEFWNQGIGTAVISLLTEYAFDILCFDEVFGLMRKENLRSIQAFYKCGYEFYSQGVMDDSDSLFCAYRKVKNHSK